MVGRFLAFKHVSASIIVSLFHIIFFLSLVNIFIMLLINHELAPVGALIVLL